ncbi:hypothetical protein F4818DRAFT_141177 [Hypoxylon cercidicola]|nr:hypothetical protein F4818DRAFT_141177 [Hypoxylon cercidicola]
MSSRAQQVQQHPTADQIHLAFFRPAILQILRAQGYYSTAPATVDTITEIAANYMMAISRQTAQHAEMNNEFGYPGLPDIVDVRMALEDCGAFWPVRDFTAQEVSRVEDTQGIDDFIQWSTGKKNQRIRKVAGLDKPVAGDVGVEGVEEQRPTDYLNALKRKHNKMDEDSKYASTILGRGIVDGEVTLEGGEETSIRAWKRTRHEASQRPPEPVVVDTDSRPASSGLSSLADEDMAMMNMDFDN